MSQRTTKLRYDFRGYNEFVVAGSNTGSPWAIADTSAAGTPIFGGLDGGGYRMQFANTSEVENLCLYFGNVLSFRADEIVSFEWALKTPATLDSATSIAWGMTSDRNDAIDSIAEAVLFRAIGSTSVVVETDDGTNDNDDVATGQTVGATYKRYGVNFAERNTTIEPPSVSLGSRSNIGFYIANDNGSMRRVASGTRFDFSNYAGSSGLQPFLQIQKTADTNTDFVDALSFEIELKIQGYG